MEVVKNELDFYSKFAGPLIFALPEAKDRALAASWVKKIKEDENTNEKLKTDYIKLLLFALQRRKLVGIFTDDPTKYETLEEFPDEYDLNAMAQDLIEIEQKERRTNIRRQLQGEMGDFPPYTTDISSDLREYVAAQDIPCFGVHCYYAISKDPITSWYNAEKGIFPKAAKSAVNTDSPLPPDLSPPDTCASCPGPEGKEPCSPGSPSPDQSEPDKRKKKSKKKLGDTPPVKPLVTETQLEEEETRKPPTWSSNLIEVIEKPRTATGAIPKVRSAKQLREDDRFGDIDSELEEDYNEMERALKDFQRGDIREQRRKREKRSKADDLDVEESSEEDGETVENVEEKSDLENFLDLNETEYEQELKEDALLVKYFRDTINKRMIQKDKDSFKDNIRGTLPAQSGIPLTTPKPSVSPKRLNIFPPIYASEEPLLKDTTKQTDTGSPKPTCPYSCSGRDADMDRIFQEASAIAKLMEDDLEADYSDTEERYVEEKIDEQPQFPEPEVPPSEPTQPITRGSPAAHKIFADVIPPLMEQLKPDDTAQQRQYPSETSEQDKSMSMPMPIPQEPTTNQEYDYLDSLFEKDKKTANTLKNVSHIISDVKQDQETSFMTSPRQQYSDRQTLSQTRQEIKSPAITPSRPTSTTKITQSSTKITTSVPAAKQKETPASAEDDRIFDFARGYVPPEYISPPRYKSPSAGVGSESPPYFMSPGKDGSPPVRTQNIPPRQSVPPVTSPPAGDRTCPSARRRLNFADVDTDTFLAQSTARQQGFLPLSPMQKPKMGFRDMDTDTFLKEAMSRQKDLPPLSTDTSPQRGMRTPQKEGLTGTGRPSPTSALFKTPPYSQMLSSEQTPPFFDSPQSPATPPFVVPQSKVENLFDTSMGDQYFSPPPVSPGTQQRFDRGAKSPPFPKSPQTADNLFDTSMGDRYFSPPPLSPGMQQRFDGVKTPTFTKCPKPQQFSPLDPGFVNLADTSLGDLYYSPPASPDMSPGMQRMQQSPPIQSFQPRSAERAKQQGVRDMQQSIRRSPPPKIAGPSPPLDKFGLPSVVQLSPLSKVDYSQLYERHPDLQSPGRRQPPSTRTPPAAEQAPSARPRLGIYDVDTDTFLAEAMARQKDLPALPADYPTPSMRTPPRRTWESPERPFLQTPPNYQMLDAIETPPFYDSPRTPGASPSPQSPDVSPGMRQMLEQLPQAQSFLRCKGTKPSTSGAQASSRSGPSRRSAPSRRAPTPLPTIAGSPPYADQSDVRYPTENVPPSESTRRSNAQSARPSQNRSSYRPCPNPQERRRSGQRPTR